MSDYIVISLQEILHIGESERTYILLSEDQLFRLSIPSV